MTVEDRDTVAGKRTPKSAGLVGQDKFLKVAAVRAPLLFVGARVEQQKRLYRPQQNNGGNQQHEDSETNEHALSVKTPGGTGEIGEARFLWRSLTLFPASHFFGAVP